MVSIRRRKLNNSNGQVRNGINDLTVELMCDILSRLPIESILSCRVVCKYWGWVTRESCFIKLQLYRSKSQLLLVPPPGKEANYIVNNLPLVDIQKCITRMIPIEKMPCREFRVMSSCNGLLCITSLGGKADPLCIVNPITGLQISLPPSNLKYIVSHYVVSFGFDCGKYKIVRYYRYRSVKTNFRFEIYSFGGASWRELNALGVDWTVCGAIFCNGVFYCQMMKKEPLGYWSINIIAIGFKDENVQLIAFPKECYPSPNPYVEMVDLKGSLTFIEHDGRQMKTWRLMGNQIGEFSLYHQYTFDTGVKWDKHFYYETMSEDDESYMLWVTSWKHNMGDHFAKFTPGAENPLLRFGVPGMPHSFKALWIKPSFVHPLVTHF